MGFPIAILGLFIIAFLLAGLVTGIALLAAGLARKRKGVWVSGLVVLLISLGIIVALGIAGALMFLVVRRSTRAVAPPVAVSGPQTMPTQIVLADATPTTTEIALAMPPDVFAPLSVRLRDKSSIVISMAGVNHRAEISVESESDFQPILSKYYEKATWDQVAPLIKAPVFGYDDRFWAASRLRKFECYRRIKTGPEDPPRPTSLCYDRKGGQVYCAWFEPLRATANDPDPPAGQ